MGDPRGEAGAGFAYPRFLHAGSALDARGGDRYRDGECLTIFGSDDWIAGELLLATFDEARVVFSGQEIRMRKQPLVEREVRPDAGQDVLAERAAHAHDRALAGRRPRAQLA